MAVIRKTKELRAKRAGGLCGVPPGKKPQTKAKDNEQTKPMKYYVL